MNYDNSKFTEALNNRGFVVAHHAQANYASDTLSSLASTLNMRHYSSNPTPFFDLDLDLRLSIADSIVARQLKELGYSYIQLLSGYLIHSPSQSQISTATIHLVVQLTSRWSTVCLLGDPVQSAR